ncbi:mtcA2, partial [Symbiodinium natans]
MSWMFTKLAEKVWELRSSTSTISSPGHGQDIDASDGESDAGSEGSLTSTDTSPSCEARGAADDEALRCLDVSTEEPMHPQDAVRLLQEGNDRFVQGTSLAVRRNDVVRREHVDLSQPPHAAIVGCSDCQASLETIFDSLPGDIFAFKNAGNTCIHANGSMVASLEFCTEQLGCRFILVLGHRRCGVLQDACKSHAENQRSGCGDCALNSLLHDMSSVIDQAAELASSVSLISADAKSPAEIAKLAEKAVEVNVFQTVELLLRFSDTIRQNVRSGAVELQAAIFDEASGKVEFLGPSPMQGELCDCNVPVPPWPLPQGEAVCAPQVQDSSAPAPEDALESLRCGNQRYV